MPEAPRKKIKKMKRPAGATPADPTEAPQATPRTPEAAIPVAVEGESAEDQAGAEGADAGDATESPETAAAGEDGSGAIPGTESGGGVDAAGPPPAEGAAGQEMPVPGEPGAEPAAPVPTEPGGAPAGSSAEPAAGVVPADSAAELPAGGEPAQRPDTAPVSPAPAQALSGNGTESAAAEEKWEAEPVEAPPAPVAGAAVPGLAPEEPYPRLAVMADDELLRLKAELSRKLLMLENDRARLDEMGNQLLARHEELEGRHRSLDEREAQIKAQDKDLSKNKELIQASSEALGALADELHARHKKVQATEAEVRAVAEGVEKLRAEIAAREERLTSERAALEDERKKAAELQNEIRTRESSLKQGEADFGRRSEELARARKEAEELDLRLKKDEAALRKKEEGVRSLEQHLQSFEEDIKLCPYCGSVEEFQALARRAEQLRERGEDLDEVKSEIKKARQALSNGFFDEATEHAGRAKELLDAKAHESDRRDIVAKIMAAEGLARNLREAKADVTPIQAALAESWAAFRVDDLKRAEAYAEKARRDAAALEQERFQALDALVASNSQLATLKKSGVNVLPAEKKREEAERAMAAGDFRRARVLAAETVVMVSEAAQSQDVSTAMSQIKLAEETLEELKSLGLDASEWERTVNRSREFLKKLDFKSAEETARWVRQKAKEAGRQYRQALLTIDHGNSVIATYRDMGLVVRKAEDLQEEAKAKLRDGDPELAANLAKKAERMVKEISERHKGAQASLRKATSLIRAERKAGKDATRSEKLYDLAQHQLELGEYANAMKLANKAVDALSSTATAGTTALELCPTCGEAIPENAPECPVCAERNRRKEQPEQPAPAAGSELAQKTKLGSKGGRKYACPYCGDLFEIMVPSRPITITCPWCSYVVSVEE